MRVATPTPARCQGTLPLVGEPAKSHRCQASTWGGGGSLPLLTRSVAASSVTRAKTKNEQETDKSRTTEIQRETAPQRRWAACMRMFVAYLAESPLSVPERVTVLNHIATMSTKKYIIRHTHGRNKELTHTTRKTRHEGKCGGGLSAARGSRGKRRPRLGGRACQVSRRRCRRLQKSWGGWHCRRGAKCRVKVGFKRR